MIRMRSIQAQKEKLEQLVKERTRELEEANTEIEAQRDLATEQRDQITVQKKAITDSIHYAQRIQRSMLPSEKVLKLLLPEHFILLKPRDIVSGDFYWAASKNHSVYFTAADCTGHGVPGAFMSMLGIAFLNEILNKFETIEPHEILDQLRKQVIKALHQRGITGETKDGMDMVLCKYNKDSRELSFAGANNPLYLVRDGALKETKGDPMPVAIHDQMDPFTSHSIKVRKNDRIYIFSDGYADQFGGPQQKKFLYKRFREAILNLQDLPMKAQGEALSKTFDDWKGSIDQVDDVVVIGIKF
jgi:serine phosphatase RsbU (regulator of sigma subunit)